ncbi:protease inhibitor I42 family protein [bacterium]|nr:protease inhibitor I42 family protein [bacterium]
MSVIHVTESDSGKILSVRVGDEVTIELKENAATGYLWDIESLGECIEQTHPVASGLFPRSLPGAAGKFRLHLVAKAPGENPLRLKYWRDWAGEGSVESRFRLTLRIEG